jgi:lipoprotein-anchoring transpeptidase ErfK/SrfK
MSARRMLTFLLSFSLVVGLAQPAVAQTGAADAVAAAPVTQVQPTQSTAAGDVLKRGDSGPKVKALQQRLRQLKYWTGPADGVFGNLTQQAVYAFQKSQGLPRDGVFGPKTRARLKDPRPVGRKSRQGRVVEIDKKRQILILVRDGKVQWIFNTSTGTEKPYVYKGKRYMADTPKGKWRIFRQVKGWRNGELGHLYNPKYFHVDGIAIHGYTSVPPHPASHGCARVTIEASNYLWTRIPIRTGVWIY